MASFDRRGSIAGAAVSVASLAGSGEIVWFARRTETPGFTARDRLELARWQANGCRRVVHETDPLEFAMLYEGKATCASWAMARQDGYLLVWNCVTLIDLGRFSSMLNALAALSGSVPDAGEPSCNVVSFAAAQLRRERQAVGRG